MSRSFDMNLTLSFRVVFTEEEIKGALEAVEEARKYVASENPTDKTRLGLSKALLAAEAKGLDEILSVFLKDVAKQFRQILVEETSRDKRFTRWAPPALTITPRVNTGPKVCSRCEVVKKTTNHEQCEVCRTCNEVT